MKSKTNYTIAAQKRWAKVSPEERAARMSVVAKQGWKNKTQAERKAHAAIMVQAHKIKARSRKLAINNL